MTPDNAPIIGPAASMNGLWMAEAIWVTHAAGAARALTQLMTGEGEGLAPQDAASVSPDRFAGQSRDRLVARALALYRDIYSSG